MLSHFRSEVYTWLNAKVFSFKQIQWKWVKNSRSIRGREQYLRKLPTSCLSCIILKFRITFVINVTQRATTQSTGTTLKNINFDQ